MNVVIKAEEFKNYLQENNLVLVHRNVIEDVASLEFLRLQKKLLKKDALTPDEIVRGRLLHPKLTTTHGIRGTKKIKPKDRFITENGKGVLMICTSAIIQLRKQFGYAVL